MIDKATVARIMDAARIEEVVADYVSLRKRGVNLIGLCPFHNEKTGSFIVSPAKGIFKCFGCSEAGSAVHFIMKIEQKSYPEALKQLAKKYNIEYKEKELTSEEVAAQNDRESMFVLNDFAQKYFADILWNNQEGRSVGLSYFKERGFRDDIIEKFGLGYSLDSWDALAVAAKAKGYKQEYLEKTGLSYMSDKGKMTDRFRGRVIFPVHTITGKVVAFGGRVLKTNDKTAKYVNSPESEIYHKSNELYGIYFAKNAIIKNDRCYLVEGYTDVLAMHQAGICNVVASSGTALTLGQIHLIRRFTSNVTVLYDGDNAGIKAAQRGIDLCLQEGMNVKVLLLPDGDDPDSFSRKHNADYFLDYIERNQVDFIRFKANLLMQEAGNDPIKKVELIHKVVYSIALIPDNIARQVYVKNSATILEMEEKILHAEVAKVRNKILKDENKDAKTENVEGEYGNVTSDEPLQQPQSTPQPTHQSSPDLNVQIKNLVVDEQIRSLLKMMVQFGNTPLYEDDLSPRGYITVGEYILQELGNDNIVFENPLYTLFVQQYNKQKDEENFVPEDFFKYHPDAALSQMTVNLIADKYVLSKMHFKRKISENSELEEIAPLSDADRLDSLVPRLIYEFKYTLLKIRTKEVLTEIKMAEELQDMNLLMEKMKLLKFLTEKQNALSKPEGPLGGRVVVKL